MVPPLGRPVNQHALVQRKAYARGARNSNTLSQNYEKQKLVVHMFSLANKLSERASDLKIAIRHTAGPTKS